VTRAAAAQAVARLVVRGRPPLRAVSPDDFLLQASRSIFTTIAWCP